MKRDYISKEDASWFFDTMISYARIKAPVPMVEWAENGNVMLPSNTSEPGMYNIKRTPYQEGMLKAISPENPAKEIILCTGSQIGKTTVEQIAMAYYIKEEPCPMGFVFSDDGNLKTFIKFKFDPFISANASIKSLFKSSGRSQADSLTSKQFSGGFLKFLSGKSESSMRSDSMRVVFLDEVDGMGRTKGGDVRALMRKRTNTFGSSSKLVLSSTPLDDGVIFDYLEESTYNKYFIRCPECSGSFSLEMDYFRWELEEGKDAVVKDAWFECPHCKHKIYNEDKLVLLSPENGAEWRATNINADPAVQGFYLPSFYAPVGWLSWLDIAKEYATAALKNSGIDHEKIRTFYNTILAKPYREGSEVMDWRKRFEMAQSSSIRRGDIPEWVEFLTTASDVQEDRIETELMGWGKNGKHIEIDYYVFDIPAGEGLDIVNGYTWTKYTEEILDHVFIREDGLRMKSVANAMDSSYKPDNIYIFYIGLPPNLKSAFYPIKGSDRQSDSNYISTKKFVRAEKLSEAVYWLVPASSLKHKVFTDLNPTLDEGEPFFPVYPQGFDEEHYQQLFSEEIRKIGGRFKWVKTRHRNEVLDLHVYNYAMYFLKGFNQLNPDDWDGLALISKKNLELQKGTATIQKHSRMLSKGFSE